MHLYITEIHIKLVQLTAAVWRSQPRTGPSDKRHVPTGTAIPVYRYGHLSSKWIFINRTVYHIIVVWSRMLWNVESVAVIVFVPMCNGLLPFFVNYFLWLFQSSVVFWKRHELTRKVNNIMVYVFGLSCRVLVSVFELCEKGNENRECSAMYIFIISYLHNTTYMSHPFVFAHGNRYMDAVEKMSFLNFK